MCFLAAKTCYMCPQFQATKVLLWLAAAKEAVPLYFTHSELTGHTKSTYHGLGQ